MGHPIPAVPIRGPHHIKSEIGGPYGPPRPVPFPGKYGPPHGPSFKPYRPHGPKPYPLFEKPSFEEITGPGGPILEHGEFSSSFIEGGHIEEGHIAGGHISGGLLKGHGDKSTVVVNANGSYSNVWCCQYNYLL